MACGAAPLSRSHPVALRKGPCYPPRRRAQGSLRTHKNRLVAISGDRRTLPSDTPSMGGGIAGRYAGALIGLADDRIANDPAVLDRIAADVGKLAA